jgi:polysaccharide export outer membrane protein
MHINRISAQLSKFAYQRAVKKSDIRREFRRQTVSSGYQKAGCRRYHQGALVAMVAALLIFVSSPIAAQDAESYTIKPGDVLKVSVWREPELQLVAAVRPDGGLSVPLAGEIMTKGLTVEQLRDAIAKRLSRYISEPTVSVSVEEVRGNTFYVLGRVVRPGEFIIRRATDVMQGLSMAGGFVTYAKVDDIKILRRENGSQIAIPFVFSNVAEGVNLKQNILLQSGDLIVVP